jgi:small subunit ribosomal protein S1
MNLEENRQSLQDASPAPDSTDGPKEPEASSEDSNEVGNLLESMETIAPSVAAQGEIVQGKVLNVSNSEVIVDVGLKSEAAIPRSEFLGADGQLTVAPGDTVDVLIERLDETGDPVVVSHQKAVHSKAWEEIEKAFRDHTTIRGRVIERIKGGLVVDVGVRAFLPGSHADIRQHTNLDTLIGQEIECQVLKLNRKRNNLVISRRQALEEERKRRKAELMASLSEGAVLSGRIKNLTNYGAFVDLGGLDGLLHITDISWGRVAHPSEVLQVGQEVNVKVLKYDAEKERISLGMKQLTPDPWDQIAATYHVGDRVTGRVVSVTDYGAFVELEPGVEGLIHISEMTWSRRLRHPSKLVKVDDRVEVTILELNTAQRRISLSLKQTLPDPWSNLSERFTTGAVVQGRVRNLTEFGAFVEIEDGVDGLIHVSNLSWSKAVKHPSEVLKKGQKIEAVVLSLDPANRRLALGLKQLQPNLWDTFFAKTRLEDVVRGRVKRVTDFGAFVELQEGIEALCHKSEFDTDFAGNLLTKPEVGKELNFRVIRLSPSDKRIGLSLKGVDQETEPVTLSAAASSSETSTRPGAPAADRGTDSSHSSAVQKAEP